MRKISGLMVVGIFDWQLWFLPPVPNPSWPLHPKSQGCNIKVSFCNRATAANIWKCSRHLPLMESKLIAAGKGWESWQQLLDRCQSILGSSSTKLPLFSDGLQCKRKNIVLYVLQIIPDTLAPWVLIAPTITSNETIKNKVEKSIPSSVKQAPFSLKIQIHLSMAPLLDGHHTYKVSGLTFNQLEDRTLQSMFCFMIRRSLYITQGLTSKDLGLQKYDMYVKRSVLSMRLLDISEMQIF